MTKTRGRELLKDPMLNKGTAFSKDERLKYGLDGQRILGIGDQGAGGMGTSFAILGKVFLVLTGGEALYADMGARWIEANSIGTGENQKQLTKVLKNRIGGSELSMKVITVVPIFLESWLS